MLIRIIRSGFGFLGCKVQAIDVLYSIGNFSLSRSFSYFSLGSSINNLNSGAAVCLFPFRDVVFNTGD